MKKIDNFYGYDIYELSLAECRENGIQYPTLTAFYDDWDEDEDGQRTWSAGECDFDTIEEAREWCREYSRH